MHGRHGPAHAHMRICSDQRRAASSIHVRVLDLAGQLLVSFPDPTLKEGLGTLERFLGLAHHHVTARAPIQIYANSHMIAELAAPRIGANVPRPFPRACVVGSGNETSQLQA